MGVLKNWLGSSFILQLLIIKFIGLLGCLSFVALAFEEASDTVGNSVVSFPDVGITCIGNLAIFITSFLRGRLDLELAARDVLAIFRGPKLNPIHRFGLTTCENNKYEEASVVFLSYQSPNSTIEQFMRYISSAHDVQSILLECLPLESAALLAEICNCNDACKCIVFCTVEEVTVMLARRMPGTLKRLTDTLCLLLSRKCLANGCHGCNQGMLCVQKDYLREDGYKITGEAVERSSVIETLDYIYEKSHSEERSCICIPVNPAYKDQWTELMIRLFRSKDKESRGVRVMASDALENYMAMGAEENYMSSDIVEARGVEVRYSQGSLIVPRIIEMFLNLALTGWFRTDGFSTSLLARRAIRDYLVDSKGTGFAANAFVTKARVKSSQVQSRSDNVGVQSSKQEEMDICQVLTFRGNLVTLKALAVIGGLVNLFCSITWAVLVAFEGGVRKGHHTKSKPHSKAIAAEWHYTNSTGLSKASPPETWHFTKSMPPSEARVDLIMAAIGIGLVMDCLHLYLRGFYKQFQKENGIVGAMIFFETVCIVLCSTVRGGLWGIKHFGRWIYSALQGLVWVKWAIGSYLLGERLPKHESGPVMTLDYEEYEEYLKKKQEQQQKPEQKWTDNGILVYSSAFLLNAFLAGVRGKWDYIASDNND